MIQKICKITWKGTKFYIIQNHKTFLFLLQFPGISQKRSAVTLTKPSATIVTVTKTSITLKRITSTIMRWERVRSKFSTTTSCLTIKFYLTLTYAVKEFTTIVKGAVALSREEVAVQTTFSRFRMIFSSSVTTSSTSWLT